MKSQCNKKVEELILRTRGLRNYEQEDNWLREVLTEAFMAGLRAGCPHCNGGRLVPKCQYDAATGHMEEMGFRKCPKCQG